MEIEQEISLASDGIKPLSVQEVCSQYSPVQRSVLRIVNAIQCAAWKVCGHKTKADDKIDAWKEMLILGYFCYYSLFERKAEAIREEIWREPTVEKLRLAWNLNESMRLPDKLTLLSSPRVSICKLIQIPIQLEGHFRSAIPAYLISYHSLPTKKKGCILHFHGGGMIANSPKSHLKYLKTWSKKLGIPIISVDYALSPEHPHPTALRECYAVYKWLLSQASSLEINSEKIVAAGDSAGGYLAIAITMKALEESIPVPSKLMLIYPHLFRDEPTEEFPRHIIFGNDVVIPRAFRSVYNQAFVHTNDPRDPFISPLMAPDSLLSRFPGCNIIVGSQDPLYDDSHLLQKRLRNLNIEVQMKVYEGFTHGFLSLGLISKQSTIANNDIVNMLSCTFC